ncbi:MAG TPA: tetratricopeptide repeat protein [Gammaproteobacteria bacterium]|nr:tetratricopeptide repeat protein [Gammaproteobacteria bacterium]
MFPPLIDFYKKALSAGAFLRQSVLFAVCALGLLHGCAGGPVARDGVSARTPSSVSAGMQSEFKRALELMAAAKYQEAVPVLEGIIAKNDQLSGAQINLAIACMNSGGGKEYYDKAEKALLRAIQINSKEPVAYNELGLLYRRTGRFEESKKAYRQAIALDSKYTMSYLNMGILCDIYLQDPICAIEFFEKYKLLAPAQAEKTEGWLTDLKRRAGITEPAVAGNAATPEAAAPAKEALQ